MSKGEIRLRKWDGPLPGIETLEFEPLSPEKAVAEARAMMEACGDFLRRLTNWRNRSLEQARELRVGQPA